MGTKPVVTKWALVEWRLRHPGIGPFPTEEAAEQHRQTMPDSRGWHVVGLTSPKARLSTTVYVKGQS